MLEVHFNSDLIPYTLSKKRNASNLTVVTFSVLLIGQSVLGDSFIRHIIDMIGVFI